MGKIIGKRSLAVLLAMLMIGSVLSEYPVSAQAAQRTVPISGTAIGGAVDKASVGAVEENGVRTLSANGTETDLHTEGFKVSDFGVYLDKDRNNRLTDDSDVYSGQDITVYFDWELDNTVRMDDTEYDNGRGYVYQEFLIDTKDFACEGIDLSSFETGRMSLYSNDPNRVDSVGYYYLEDGIIHIVITDGEFYQITTNRIGGVSFHGKLEELKDPKEDGNKKSVKFGDASANPAFYLSEKESQANVKKERVGDRLTVVDGPDGSKKYYQTFTVTIKAENGTVKNIDLSDTTSSYPENLLGAISDVEVTASTVNGVTVGKYTNLDKVLEDIKNATFYMGDEVTLQYTMEVDAAIYQPENTWAINTISGNYTSNRSEESKSVRSDAGISANKPSIDKKGTEYDAAKGTVIWEITIDMGDYYTQGGSENLADYLKSIQDIPGYGLDVDAQKLGNLDLSQFKHKGNGVWVGTIEMPVTEDVKNSHADEVVVNKVTMTTKDDNEYTTEGKYTVVGQDAASIEKSVGSAEREKDNLYVTWRINVSNIPDGIKDFTIVEHPSAWVNNQGSQQLVPEIYVNGTKVYGESNVLDTSIIKEVSGITDSWNCSIVFQDAYIKNHKSFYVDIKTLITEDTTGKQYGNSADITYKDDKTGNPKSVGSNTAVYRDTTNLLTKEGKVSGNAIDYELKLAIPALNIEQPGKSFVIEDILPLGMKLDESSVKVVLRSQWNWDVMTLEDAWYTWNADEYIAEQGNEQQRQKLTVNVKAVEDWLKNVTDYPSVDGSHNGDFLSLRYTAVVEDEADFVAKGKPITCTNEASASYDGTPVGSDSDTRDLTPTKVVSKKAELTSESYPFAKYTVEVNKAGVTLLDGEERLHAVDTVGWVLSLVDSDDFLSDDDAETNMEKYAVRVYDVNDSNRELVKGKDYDYTISEDKSTMTMDLPDGKYLRIVYWARIKLGYPLSEYNSTNSFELSGFSSEAMKDETYFSNAEFSPQGWAGSRDSQIILYKFWTDDKGDQQALSGSKFRLDKMKYDASQNKLVVDNDNSDDPDRPEVYKFPREDIVITDENRYGEGMLVIEGLPVNTIFALYEVEANTGYAVNKEPYYFTVEGSTALEVPDEFNIYTFKANEVLKYENVPDGTVQAKIKISKTWSEDGGTHKLTWDKIKGNISFVIRNEDNQIVRTCKGSDLNRVGNTSEYEREFLVAPGTYTVEETSRDLENFEVTTTITYHIDSQVTTKGPDADKTDNIVLEEADSVEVTFANVYTYDGSFVVKISKRDIVDGDEIAGAKLTITGETLDHVAIEPISWTSGDDGTDSQGNIKPHEVDLKPGTYTLTEVIAPNGYAKAKSIIFTVSDVGGITVTNGAGEVTGGDTIVMEDAPLDIEVDKFAIGGSEEVPGATIYIYKQDDINADGTLKAGAQEVYHWTSEEGKTKDISKYLSAGTTYVMIETDAPAGYAYSENIVFTVGEYNGKVINVRVNGQTGETLDTTNGTKNNRIIMRDNPFHVMLNKVELGSGEELEGARIAVYKAADIDASGEPRKGAVAQDAWTSRLNETHDFGGKLKAGESYVFVERVAPKGHELANNIYFTVEKNGEIRLDAPTDVKEAQGVWLMEDALLEEGDYASLIIKKTVSGDMTVEELNGGLTFNVQSEDGTTYNEDYSIVPDFELVGKEWVLELNNLPVGKYKVTEQIEDLETKNVIWTVTYGINAEPTIDGHETDLIELGKDDEVTVAYNNNCLRTAYDVEISKRTIAGVDELEGAVLEVARKEGGEFIERWTSGEDGEDDQGRLKPHMISLAPNEEYTLTEITAPKGYAKAETITFKVEKDGTVTSPTNNVSDGNTVIMRDKALDVTLSKVSLVGSKELEGAEIYVYRQSDVPNGQVKDGAEYVAHWTSTKRPFDFGPFLSAGEDYVFVEEAAPTGYLVASKIYFSIKDDGTLNLRPAANNYTYTYDDGIIYMQDAVSPRPVASLELTKSVEGDLTYDQLSGKLKFRVEGLDVDYDKTFTVGKDKFIWVSSRQKYVMRLQNLDVGTYRVTEILDNSTPDGLFCAKQLYTVSANGMSESMRISYANSDFSTDDFTLEENTDTTVEYSNTYALRKDDEGTLIIQKKISGPVTLDEVDGALRFKVTETASGKVIGYYKLKSDFSYDENTKVWTLRLNAVKGGYTVEEIVTTLDGRTLTVKYAVDGGKAKTGKSAKVTVKAGDESMVQFENTYKDKKSSSKSSGGGDDNDDTPVLMQVANAVVTSLTQTGDGAPLGIWLLLLVCGGAGVIAGAVVLKRRKKRD